ncbi:unnamed protein product [Amoebophrya sp. A120]|nr:unnamed protein product [Amoebophrya sp. A120]|eukprot:GSA120T00020255001.1
MTDMEVDSPPPTAAELAEAEKLSSLPKPALTERTKKKERTLLPQEASVCTSETVGTEEKGTNTSAPVSPTTPATTSSGEPLPQRKAAKERPVLPPEIQKLADEERKEWRQWATERAAEFVKNAGNN